MTVRLHGNWSFDTLAEANATPGPLEGDLITTLEGHAFHRVPGKVFPHGPRRNFLNVPAGSLQLVDTVSAGVPGVYHARLILGFFDETGGTGSLLEVWELFGLKTSGSNLADFAPPNKVAAYSQGAGSSWTTQILTQASAWRVFITHNVTGGLRAGVTCYFGGSRWDGQ